MTDSPFEKILNSPLYIKEGSTTPVASKPKATQQRRAGAALVETEPLPDSVKDLRDIITHAGFDPEYWTLRPGTGIRKSKWEAMRRVDGETVVEPLSSYKLDLVERQQPVDVDELVRAVANRTSPTPISRTLDDGTFVLAWGDSQVGKSESPLLETLGKFQSCVEQAVEDWKRSGTNHVHIAALGDACEGIVSQGGKNMWRTTLTITEQVRVLRRLYLWIIDQFLDAGVERLTFVTVASNHGQAQRQPVETRADDDWGIEALNAVADAIALNTQRYGNVEIYTPGVDEANITMDLGGVMVAHSHGHHFYKGSNAKASVFKWWQGATFSGIPEGSATLLLTGHGHHLEMAEESGRTWLMVPAVELQSNWWQLKTGQTGDPGVVSFQLINSSISNFNRIRPVEGN